MGTSPHDTWHIFSVGGMTVEVENGKYNTFVFVEHCDAWVGMTCMSMWV